MKITQILFDARDPEYASFQSKLVPNVPNESFIGVRVPEVRSIARKYISDSESTDFMKELPHTYYDENVLHGVLISLIKDYDMCVSALDDFLPYIDNWAVCDIITPKIFSGHKKELIKKIREWTRSPHTYTCRFGMEMLMAFFLDDDFLPEYLLIPASVKSDEYYVNMMIAWYFATALAKQWDDTVKILEDGLLDKWVHNKTIQKARESYRITKEQKEYLNTLKIVK